MNFQNIFFSPLKLDKSNIFFWSDLHLGHKCEHWNSPLWKNRGFNSVEEHDTALIQKWNDTISKDSTVFVLGDIMFGSNGEQRLFEILNEFNFHELHLMAGNHHAGFKQIFNKSEEDNGARFVQLENKKVYFIPNYFELYVCDQPVVLSHYPLASWNGQSKGSWMIHGHCHGNLYNSEVGKLLYNNCKIIDVGVESSPYPRSFVEIKKLFEQKENKTFDHHDNKTLNPF